MFTTASRWISSRTRCGARSGGKRLGRGSSFVLWCQAVLWLVSSHRPKTYTMIRDLIVNGKSQTIDVRHEDGLTHFSLPDRSGSASIVEVEPGVYSVLMDG